MDKVEVDQMRWAQDGSRYGIAFYHGPFLCGIPANANMPPFPPFLEYGDADLAQRFSLIRHRGDIDLKTRFSRNITLPIPISSAPMATVTGAEMAIAIGIRGGIGVLHRGMSIEEQVRELRRVKHKAHIGKPIKSPVALTVEHTKEDALAVFDIQRFGARVGSIVIVDSFLNQRVVGIVTPRDIKGSAPITTPLKDIMSTPCVTAPHTITIQEAERLLRDEAKKKQLPLVDENGRLAGLITIQDIDLRRDFPNAALDEKGRILSAVALGLEDLVDRAAALIEEEPDAFVLDIAHGGMDEHFKALKYLKRTYSIDIIASNVHEPDLVVMLRRAGADGCRVGIGPGAQCTTRMNTGVGGSQLTAVLRCAEVAGDMPIIADGGIRKGTDIGEALAAGASCVMIGTYFAGTEESPGEKDIQNGMLVKKHFGMASNEAKRILQNLDRSSSAFSLTNLGASPEGREDWIPYQGSVVDKLTELLGWLRSTMSYLGASTIPEMPTRAIFNVRHVR